MKFILVEGNNWLKSLVFWNVILLIVVVIDIGVCNRISIIVLYSYIDVIGICFMYFVIFYSVLI